MENKVDVDSMIREAFEKVYRQTGIAVSRISADWAYVGTCGNPFQHVLTFIEIGHAYVDPVKKENKGE